jgi:outer membrane immunogenic protein
MIRTAALALAAAVLVGPAQAADLVTKAPTPAQAVSIGWSGFYAGVNAGASFAPSDISYSNEFTATNTAGIAGPNGRSSFIGGAQIGYNWQFGAWVLGGEADIMFRKSNVSEVLTFGDQPTPPESPFGSVFTDRTYMKTEQNWLGTLRARLGYASGNYLVYATGGLAYGDVKHSYLEILAPGKPPSPFSRLISESGTQTGWTVGAGAEMRLNAQWSAGVEYLYVDLGKTTLHAGETVIWVPFPSSTMSVRDDSHIVRFKLNYTFGGGAPVAASS